MIKQLKKQLPLINLCALCLLFTILGYSIGRLTTKIMALEDVPPPYYLGKDINKGVPMIFIERITNGVLHGKTGDHYVRIVLDDELVEVKDDNTFEVEVGSIMQVLPVQIPNGMNFVASKKGKKVYSVGSKQGEKIKPENRVYFQTEEEALEKGYTN